MEVKMPSRLTRLLDLLKVPRHDPMMTRRLTEKERAELLIERMRKQNEIHQQRIKGDRRIR